MSTQNTHFFPNKSFPWWLIAMVFLAFSIVVNHCHGQQASWYKSQHKEQTSSIIEVAKTQIGVKEVTGKNDGTQVEQYLATTGLGTGYAWCAAFVNWTMIQSGNACPAKMQAWSPSWFPPARTYWQLGVSERFPPQPGDVFGIYFKSKGRIAHVGLIELWKGSYAITIEGNTNEAGSREGDGVWRKRRLKRQISKVSNWTNG